MFTRFRGLSKVLTLAFCVILLSGFAGFAQTPKLRFDPMQMQVDPGVEQVAVDFYVSSALPFASLDIGVQVEGDLVLKAIQYTSPYASFNAVKTVKGDVTYFGFLNNANNISGETKIATLIFTYKGTAPAKARFTSDSFLVHYVMKNGNQVPEKMEVASMGDLSFTRRQVPPTNPGNPSQPINPTPEPNPIEIPRPVDESPIVVELENLLIPLGNVEVTFKDIDNSWAKEYIALLASRGIINGVTKETFVPGASITRADFTKILVGVLNLESKKGFDFEDVKPTDYYYDAVQAASAAGLITGYEGKFNPKDTLSRQDMMVILHRAFKQSGIALNKQGDLNQFTDNAFIAPYARNSVSLLVGEKIIEGSGGMIRPKDTLSRAEASKVLYYLLAAVEK